MLTASTFLHCTDCTPGSTPGREGSVASEKKTDTGRSEDRKKIEGNCETRTNTKACRGLEELKDRMKLSKRSNRKLKRIYKTKLRTTNARRTTKNLESRL